MRRTDRNLTCARWAARPSGSTDLRTLLLAPGVGPLVIRRLEEAGVCSVADLVRRGVEPTVDSICASMGHHAWRNRRDALVRALTQALFRQPTSGAE
jgi:predicted RecB family nuclease